MIAFPGNTASVIYTVESSGALAAAATGPTYTLYKNGSVVDTTSGTPTVTLTATTIATGVYRVSYTVPGSGFAVNDVLELFAATGSTGSAVVGRWVILPASLLTLPSFPTNFASLGISVGGAISNVTTAGSVTSGVTLAATTHTGATIPTVTTVTNLTNAPTSGDLTATMKASVTAAVPSVTQIRTEMDTNSTQLAAISAAVDLVKAKTDNLPSSPAAVGSAMTLTSAYDAAKTAASQTSLNSLLTTALTESYPSKNGTVTVAQALYVILAHLEESIISGMTKTIRKRDQSTTAETFTLDSATAPTTITRAT